MFKNISTFWERLIRTVFYILAVALIIFCIVMFFSSCNPEKKIERDDQKAVNRVNAKAPLQIPVVNAYLAAHPIDTTPRLIVSAPKIINIEVPKLIKDTTGRQRLIDSTITANKKELDCGKAARDAFDLGYDEAEKYYLVNPIKVQCPPDTTKTYFLTSQINNLTDSVNSYKQQLSFKQGQLEALSETSQSQKKDIEKWLIFFIISAVVNLVLLILLIKSYLSKITKL